MSGWSAALIVISTVVAMEGVAWATHRYIMHGPLWVLHRSHHEPRRGMFEWNDLFAVFFAAMAIGLFALGIMPGWEPAFWLALGVTLYGVLYALAHDGLVHGRWPVPLKPRGPYLRRLVQAHRLHHAIRDRDGAVSFGFLVPPDPVHLREALRARRKRRQA